MCVVQFSSVFLHSEGFGMLESGIVSLKNEVNIMMKNVVDVVLGGVTYWAFGYGLSYGSGEARNIIRGYIIDTGLPAYSDSAGTLKKCHSKRGASYCVTISKHSSIQKVNQEFEKSVCKQSSPYCVPYCVTVTGVTVRGESCNK